MIDNPYARWLSEDNDKCLPVIEQAGIFGILAAVGSQVRGVLGDGPTPLMSALDLEQIQVADYAGFDGFDEAQATEIRKFQKQSPVRAEEMLFLGLRSLFQFTWPEPRNEEDIRYAAAFDFVLNQVLTTWVGEIAGRFSSAEGLLPYWGRLAFLRVMVNLPTENVARFGLDKVAVALVKKAKFNATTWGFDERHVIALNYALEPILKQLNRYLLHYHSTQKMAGPARLSRAWRGIVPIVLHFWSDVVATKLVEPSVVLYGEDMAVMLHNLTSDQVDFIVSHELGHVALNHPKRFQAAKEMGGDVTTVRHEFEFGADTFALGLMRSRLIGRMKQIGSDDRQPNANNNLKTDVAFELHEHQRALGAAYLLFIYMDFIQRAGELVRDRLGNRVPFLERMDTHPRANERLRRLELINAGEHLYTSTLQRYARDFFDTVLDHVQSLSDEELLASLAA
ncbi:hypothetical protein [Aminobacter ciceronei]|uniref:Peptidase M48 domain-containing protein n=1 Tax=Aminobacter ciceronei TaxID=150723 RepID=A0ABR6C4A5_9HYPH|nr:hypothetical protein [Aminobacter ciceronei]MBA8906052.1 hypothetical protein [Aminobacter ciceronei]MBA9019831.1 hypothetical protein [Aminobacter ciceronei]